jgi:hypothetical protein
MRSRPAPQLISSSFHLIHPTIFSAELKTPERPVPRKYRWAGADPNMPVKPPMMRTSIWVALHSSRVPEITVPAWCGPQLLLTSSASEARIYNWILREPSRAKLLGQIAVAESVLMKNSPRFKMAFKI